MRKKRTHTHTPQSRKPVYFNIVNVIIFPSLIRDIVSAYKKKEYIACMGNVEKVEWEKAGP